MIARLIGEYVRIGVGVDLGGVCEHRRFIHSFIFLFLLVVVSLFLCKPEE